MPEKTNRAHLSATVYGRVQGVFFRDFVRTTATKLGLTGYVRNLPRGDAVEVHAEGPVSSLELLVSRLKTGPRGADVSEVETDWSGYSGEFQGFGIRY
jgi:acylphosphatase